MPVWLSAVPWSHQICSGRILDDGCTLTLNSDDGFEDITAVQPITPHADDCNHGNGEFLPGRWDTWEERVDGAIVSHMEDELVWKGWRDLVKTQQPWKLEKNAPMMRSGPTVREMVWILASAGFLKEQG